MLELPVFDVMQQGLAHLVGQVGIVAQIGEGREIGVAHDRLGGGQRLEHELMNLDRRMIDRLLDGFGVGPIGV